MRNWPKTLVLFTYLLFIPLILLACSTQNSSYQDKQEKNPQQQNQETSKDNKNNNSNSEEQKNTNQADDSNKNTTHNPDQGERTVVWGVDSASYTTEHLYQCVKNNYGKPQVWGRYLGTEENVSAGIDQQEVNLLHSYNVQILVIYNHVEEPTGYNKGVREAEEAIAMAKNLGIPSGVAIFVDVEPIYPVDSAFIQGWYDTLSSSTYHAGIYGVFDPNADVLTAFNNTSQDVQDNMVVWSAFPQQEITTKESAPMYNPHGPENSLLYGWQYAIEAETCNIDTNLFKPNMLNYLW